MLYSRYEHAAAMAGARRVLELGCGPGLGMGLVGERAALLVGADYDADLLARAKATYGRRFPLVCLDGQRLPFSDGGFDLVFFFEGSYYVPDMELVFDEMSRVLAPGGAILFVNANPERTDFIRSPLSVHYHSADQFRESLERRGFSVTVEGAFARDVRTLGGRITSRVRRLAERMGLIPRTLAGRALLKKVLVRRLVRIPDRVPRHFGVPVRRMEILPGLSASAWKVLYVTARRPDGP
jgi:SAM-dependent methyltransferase